MVAGDFRLMALFVLAMSGAVGLAYLVLRALGYDPRRALTSTEWRIVFKLVGAALMFYTVLLRTLYAAAPVEKFIYGRF